MTRRHGSVVARPRILVVLLAATLATAGLVACGGSDGGDDRPAADQAPCPVDALEGAKKPVRIRFWHQQVRANADELKRQVARFNGSQRDVRVELVAMPSYQESLNKYKSALTSGSGDLPDVGVFSENDVQTLLDSRSTVSMQSCVDRSRYSLDDFVPRTISYYTVRGRLVSMPWIPSNPILIFNAAAFRRAGLDPAKPPRTLDEVTRYSRRIVETGAAKHGIALQIAPYIPEFLYAKSGQAYVNNGGGRKARATRALLDNPTGRAIWGWWKRMVDSGLAMNTGAKEGGYDHLLAIGTGDAAMTIEGSGVLGPVTQVLEAGQYSATDLGTGPLPSLKGGGGVPVGDGSLWITSKTSPAKQAAAWRFVRFLVEPPQIVGWMVAKSGYVPVRRSAAESPTVQELWRRNPEYSTAYLQLLAPGGPAADGSIIGDYQGVRDAVTDGMVAMLTGRKSMEKALADTEALATSRIRAYNERVGG